MATRAGLPEVHDYWSHKKRVKPQLMDHGSISFLQQRHLCGWNGRFLAAMINQATKERFWTTCNVPENLLSFTTECFGQAHGLKHWTTASDFYSWKCLWSAPIKAYKEVGTCLCFVHCTLHQTSTKWHVDCPEWWKFEIRVRNKTKERENHLATIWSHEMTRMTAVQWSNEIINYMLTVQSARCHAINYIVDSLPGPGSEARWKSRHQK